MFLSRNKPSVKCEDAQRVFSVLDGQKLRFLGNDDADTFISSVVFTDVLLLVVFRRTQNDTKIETNRGPVTNVRVSPPC